MTKSLVVKSNRGGLLLVLLIGLSLLNVSFMGWREPGAQNPAGSRPLQIGAADLEPITAANVHRLERLFTLTPPLSPLPEAGLSGIRWTALAWSPDDQRLAVTGDPYVGGSEEVVLQILNVPSAEWMALDVVPDTPVMSLAWSPDGASLAGGSWFKSAWVWNMVSGETEYYSDAFRWTALLGVAWMPDGQGLIVTEGCAPYGEGACGLGTSVILDADTWEPLSTLEPETHGDQYHPHHPTVSPDGRYVAWTNEADGDVKLWLWDVSDNAVHPMFSRINTRTLAWAPDSTRLAFGGLGGDGKVYFWNIEAQFLQTISGLHTNGNLDKPGAGEVSDLAWCSDGTCVISLGNDGVRAWSLPEYIDLNGEELAFIEMRAKLMALSGDGTQLALMTPDTLEIWGVQALAPSD